MDNPSESIALSAMNHYKLGHCPKGWRGRVVGFLVSPHPSLSWRDAERCFLDMGFVEGALVEVLHEGPIFCDPMAIRIHDMTVALRRHDADLMIVSDSELYE